jgi:hypothetical protein
MEEIAASTVVVDRARRENDGACVDATRVAIVKQKEGRGGKKEDSKEKQAASHSSLLLKVAKWGEADRRTAKFARGTLYNKEVMRREEAFQST